MNSPRPFIVGDEQHGFTLIEILITLVITAFGLLALAGFVIKATTLTADAAQRARAGILLNDMASRIANHKVIAATFVTGAAQGSAAIDCTGKTDATLDLCEWNNLLTGANDAGGTSAAILGYRGCITAGGSGDYIVTVAWGSLTPGVPPPAGVDCGKDQFGDESQRRIIRTVVRVATLSA